MSDQNKGIAPEGSGEKKMIFAMATIGIICAFLIVVTYESTKVTIENNRAKALEDAVFQVIPGITKTKTFQLNPDQTFTEMTTNNPKVQKVLAGYDGKGVCKGVAFQGSGKAYGDVLSLLFGYDPEQQKIIGFYVLESKETPGIGDKIEKDPFLANMKSMDVALKDDHSTLKNEIKTVKNGQKTNGWEIDAITGATITSRAVGNILNTSSKEWIPKIYKNKQTFSSNVKTEK
ncbi:MAG: FMN-binding protein [Saprospiraceae bacterium]